MRILRMIALVLILLSALTAEALSENSQILRVNYYLIAENPNSLINFIRKKTSEWEGYVKFFFESKIIVRVPAGTALKFREYVARKGYLIDEQVFRENVSEQMIDLKTRLKVKEKLLKDFYTIFESSQFHQTLDVEREIGKLIIEIERIKGKINYYTDRISLSEVTVNINYRVPVSGTEKKVTKWDWINKLGIPPLLNISY